MRGASGLGHGQIGGCTEGRGTRCTGGKRGFGRNQGRTARAGSNDSRGGEGRDTAPRQGQREPKPPSVTKEKDRGRRDEAGGKQARVGSRKANLTFISGILGFTPRRTLSRNREREGPRYGGSSAGGTASTPSKDPSSRKIVSSPFSPALELREIMSGQFAVEGASIERDAAIETFRADGDRRVLRAR